MKFNLFEAANEKMFIVAHRGSAGGNIPCNTIVAYETAGFCGSVGVILLFTFLFCLSKEDASEVRHSG